MPVNPEFHEFRGNAGSTPARFLGWPPRMAADGLRVEVETFRDRVVGFLLYIAHRRSRGGIDMKRPPVTGASASGIRGPRRFPPLVPVPASILPILLGVSILLGALLPAEATSARTAPVVTDVEFINLPERGDTFRLGEKIFVRVTFDRDVTVNTLSWLTLSIGSSTDFAWYFARLGRLVGFEYTVTRGHLDANGVSIAANALFGTIVDAADGATPADLKHAAVPDDPLRKVDGTPPTPGVTVRPRTRTVPEGGTASYAVTLDTAPTRTVTVSVAAAADSDPDLTATPARLAFTASNWDTGQTVTVSAAEDKDGTDGTATFEHTATSSDRRYDGIEIADLTATENDDEFAHFIPFFPSASHRAQGFVRVINRSDASGEVYISGVDDDGVRHGPVTLALSALESVLVSSGHLESGAREKGLTGRLGDGAGMWRLELATHLHILPLAYIRTSDGFMTAMQGAARTSTGEDGTTHHVPFFNPGSNARQASRLRISNRGPEEVAVVVEGIDDDGVEGKTDVRLTLAGGAVRTLTARALESGGSGLIGRLGDGAGKWRLDVTADGPVEVVNLLESPTGHLANLSAGGLRGVAGDEAGQLLPLFPAAGLALEGFARIINHSDTAGTATIHGIDDGGKTYGPIKLALKRHGAAHFNSSDLESGNRKKGLSGGLGDGKGSWRLLISSDLDIESLAYVRTSDGFVTPMHEVVRENALGQHVPFFNPASNRRRISRLRLVNPTGDPVRVTVSGRDDAGRPPSGSPVHLTLAPGEARSVTARELESGGSGLRGRLGDGAGKWQLFVSSDASIEVASLLESPAGHLANLSASAGTDAVADPIILPTGVETIAIDGRRVEAAADQVLVFLDEDITRGEFFDLRAQARALAVESAFDPELRMLQLVVDSRADEAEIIGELEARAGVAAAGPNSLVYTDTPPAIDNAPGYLRFLERSRGHRSAGPDAARLALPDPAAAPSFSGSYWIDTIRATSAWEMLSRETLHDNTIGVVDTGLPGTQDVLAESRVSRFDEAGNSLSDDDTPESAHGLWVSGFAAGYGDNPTRRGVNPHSNLVSVDVKRARTSFPGRLACKVGLSCTFVTSIVQGIKTAINQGAEVVNVSWGDGSECSDRHAARLSSRRSFRLDKVGAMHFAREKDALVVWSAGNNCEKRDDRLLPPAADTEVADSWRSHALIVAASDDGNRDACWSRMGGVVNLAAPGDGVGWGRGERDRRWNFVLGAAGHRCRRTRTRAERDPLRARDPRDSAWFRERPADAPDDGGEPCREPSRLQILPRVRDHLVRHHSPRDPQSRHHRRDRVADEGYRSGDRAEHHSSRGPHRGGHGRRPIACFRGERARHRLSHRSERKLRRRHRHAAVAGKTHHRRPERSRYRRAVRRGGICRLSDPAVREGFDGQGLPALPGAHRGHQRGEAGDRASRSSPDERRRCSRVAARGVVSGSDRIGARRQRRRRLRGPRGRAAELGRLERRGAAPRHARDGRALPRQRHGAGLSGSHQGGDHTQPEGTRPGRLRPAERRQQPDTPGHPGDHERYRGQGIRARQIQLHHRRHDCERPHRCLEIPRSIARSDCGERLDHEDRSCNADRRAGWDGDVHRASQGPAEELHRRSRLPCLPLGEGRWTGGAEASRPADLCRKVPSGTVIEQ